MNTNLNLVIATEISLAGKILESLKDSILPFDKVVSLTDDPYKDEATLRYKGENIKKMTLEDIDWSAYHYLFIAGELKDAIIMADAAESGCIVIDINAVCGGLQDVPMVLPSVNDDVLQNFRQRNIVSLPDPQISQLLLPLASLLRQGNIDRLFVSSLVPASYINNENVTRLAGQTARLLNGMALEEDDKRLAFDLFPLNKNAEMTKLDGHLEKVIGNQNIISHIHSVQVPLFYGLAQQVSLVSEYPLDKGELENQWNENTLLSFDPETTFTPIKSGEAEQAQLLHISDLVEREQSLTFWSVCDEQWFSLARLCIKLAETIYQQGY